MPDLGGVEFEGFNNQTDGWAKFYDIMTSDKKNYSFKAKVEVSS